MASCHSIARRLTVPAFVLAVLALVPIACSGSGDADEGPEVKPVQTSRPEAAFAPLLLFHNREKYWPMSAAYFLDHASLEWDGGPCGFEFNIASGKFARRLAGQPVPLLDPRRLGREPAYRYRPRTPDCSAADPRAPVYTTTQHTRMFDRDDRPAGLGADDGLYLDILTESFRGDPQHRPEPDEALTGVPVYYAREDLGEGQAVASGDKPGETEPTVMRLSYWALFGYGRGKSDAIDGLADREGDWDRVDVVLRRVGADRYVPLRVRYWWPKGMRAVDWADVELTGPGGTHPVAYLAPVSHTPRPGALGAPDGQRTPWRTWELLRDVRDEPWFGFGGGWGSQGQSSNGTGPLGPSPFNLATESNVKAVVNDLSNR